jgi:transcriptional regulator with XRE-family HTH domain
MIADKIKYLRMQNGYTQASLAKQLGVTRSGVNAWEMGISVPSTQCIVELASFFKVSADYLLDIESSSSIDTTGLTADDIQAVYHLVNYLRQKNGSKS